MALGGMRSRFPTLLQTIYNAITNGTPCVIVEGSGRVADVIAQVANLPVAKITMALVQKKLSVLFHDTYELFTDSKLVEWTKKVSPLQAPLSFGTQKGSWPTSSKGASGKFEGPHPSSSLSSSSAPPQPAPFGQRGSVCDQPLARGGHSKGFWRP